MTLRTGRRLLLAPAGVLLATLVAGCGTAHDAEGQHVSHGTHTMSDGSTMSDSEMSQMSSPSADAMKGDQADAKAGPTDTASMICSDEIVDAVKRNFALATNPTGTPSWKAPVFHCSYALPHGTLKMSVADLSPAEGGRAWYAALRHRLPGASTIKGMSGFGFPAFETKRGDVVFLKDGKTLWVDASGVSAEDLPPGFTRTATAYGVAAAVIACWTE